MLLLRQCMCWSTWRQLSSVRSSPSSLAVFDRQLKRKQRDWAAIQPDIQHVGYLREEVGWRIADKVADLMKRSERVLEIGDGMVAKHLETDRVGHVTLVECSHNMAERAEPPTDDKVGYNRLVGDEESLDVVEGQSFDLVLSSLTAHWINDLPGWMRRVHGLLAADSPLIGAMLAEDTLFQLRCSLQLAEMERVGGVSSHLSPLVRPSDIGSLLSSAGFQLITLDSDEIEVCYPSMVHLLIDLQLMGESGCSHSRPLHLRRDIAIAASAIYQSMYGREDAFPATFRVLSFIGWTEGPTTPKPAKRGSHTHSLKQISDSQTS